MLSATRLPSASGSLDANDATRLLAADSQAQYAGPGHLLFVRQGSLFAQPFDEHRRQLTGEAFGVADHVMPDSVGGAAFSVSDTGVLIYRTGGVAATQLTWVDRSGRPLGTVGPPGAYRNPALSPDGARVAVEMTDVQRRTQDIWLVELARGASSRFTFDPQNDIYPAWSPDGSRIAFGSDRGDDFSMYLKPSNGATSEQLLLETPGGSAPYSWSPDGQFIVSRAGPTATTGPTFGVLPLTGNQKPHLFERTTFVPAYASVSPTNRWLAYMSNESGRAEVYVRSFPDAGGKYQISKDGGTAPRWRGDGKELFFTGAEGQLMAVPIAGEAALQVGSAVTLFRTQLLPTGIGFRQQYDVTRDGQRFLLNVLTENAAPSAINRRPELDGRPRAMRWLEIV